MRYGQTGCLYGLDYFLIKTFRVFFIKKELPINPIFSLSLSFDLVLLLMFVFFCVCVYVFSFLKKEMVSEVQTLITV